MKYRQNLKYYVAVAIMLCCQGVIAQPDVIAEWNREATILTLVPSQAPVQQGRIMAIVQLSMHDAVNGITREYKTYLSPAPVPAGASPVAAAIAAGHHSLRNLFPGNDVALDAKFLASLAANGLAVDNPGVAYGQAAAGAILLLRSTDGAAGAQFPYSAPGAGNPGVWVPLSALPTAQALLPGWGEVTPFILRSSSQFRPEAPPALDSEEYAQDYNEIKEIGAAGSTTRTVLQTQIATFWLGSPVAIWNQPLRTLVAGSGFNLSERARVFAIIYLAAADAGFACWEAKYQYNFWRPQPAIRRGNEDGNDATIQDATWTPLHPTPRHPEYPSGHSSNSTAIATVFAKIFGDTPGVPITATITPAQPPAPAPPVPPITRTWNSFSEGTDEVIEARIYSGIHFRTADVAGSRMGKQVGNFVYAHALKPCKGKQCY